MGVGGVVNSSNSPQGRVLFHDILNKGLAHIYQLRIAEEGRGHVDKSAVEAGFGDQLGDMICLR